MQTVIRNDKGVITHLHYTRNIYLKVKDEQKVSETEITPDMISKAGYDKPENLFMSGLLNGENPAILKLNIINFIENNSIKKYNQFGELIK